MLGIHQATFFKSLQSICHSHTPFYASLICSSLLSLHARAGISDSDCGTQIAVALLCLAVLVVVAVAGFQLSFGRHWLSVRTLCAALAARQLKC